MDLNIYVSEGYQTLGSKDRGADTNEAAWYLALTLEFAEGDSFLG